MGSVAMRRLLATGLIVAASCGDERPRPMPPAAATDAGGPLAVAPEAPTPSARRALAWPHSGDTRGAHLAADDDPPFNRYDDYDDEDDDLDQGPDLPQDVVTRVRHTFHRLEAGGDLPEERWQLGVDPPALCYAHIPLSSDFARGIYDGYAFEALVPVAADGSACERFYVLRAGGIAGWQFLAGPFVLSDHVATTVITEQLAEQTIGIACDDQIAVELDAAAWAGGRWYATPGPLGRPQLCAQAPAGQVRIVFTPDPAALTPGGVYRVHLLYHCPGVRQPAREFVAYVQVRIGS